MVTCIIHIILLMTYLWIMCVSTTFYLFFSSFRNCIRIILETIQPISYEHEERYLYWIIMMMKEITLIIVYSLLAFFFKFFGSVKNDFSITQMHVCLWFIEASFFPILFVCCFGIYYVRCMCADIDGTLRWFSFLLLLFSFHCYNISLSPVSLLSLSYIYVCYAWSCYTLDMWINE
jgi:hypothetical protein